eukprot:CAMPEP_0117500544 /NCGR_PEP_ID=MMETSP0784-20121206/22830_1 /TAXON_ID=39447 /ORGANISM="" /LENGTH=644 /DNA_ID=CAMNT_0005295755 /DNA_START=35 /DNA_END=1965 /DNA_ORIENTATION=+
MTCMPAGNYRFTEDDLRGVPEPPRWEHIVHDAFGDLGDRVRAAFNRPLIVASPCVGLANATRALRQMHVDVASVLNYDIRTELAEALCALHGDDVTLHLGPDDGDITRLRPGDLPEHCDLLVAGPPCPPWAGNGKHQSHMDSRAKVFAGVMDLVEALATSSGLLGAFLENVTGIMRKLHGSDASFMDVLKNVVEKRIPHFAWDVITLSAQNYMLAHERSRVFLRGVHRQLLPETFAIPPPMPPFGSCSVRKFLDLSRPPTPREDLTENMQQNLKDFEGYARQDIISGRLTPGSILVFEVDRAKGKTYKQRMVVDAVPCLRTCNKYMFVMSTHDLDLPDEKREIFRWLMCQERPALQGVSPTAARYLTANNVIHACGNAYPVPMVAAVLAPVLDQICRCATSWALPQRPSGLPNSVPMMSFATELMAAMDYAVATSSAALVAPSRSLVSCKKVSIDNAVATQCRELAEVREGVEDSRSPGRLAASLEPQVVRMDVTCGVAADWQATAPRLQDADLEHRSGRSERRHASSWRTSAASMAVTRSARAAAKEGLDPIRSPPLTRKRALPDLEQDCKRCPEYSRAPPVLSSASWIPLSSELRHAHVGGGRTPPILDYAACRKNGGPRFEGATQGVGRSIPLGALLRACS